MIGKLLTGLAIAALASTSLMAAETKNLMISQDHRMVFAAPHASAHITPNFVQKPKAAIIFSNLATAYPKGLYFAGEGATVCGIDCGLGEQVWSATGFTPAASATATEVDVAVGYIGGTDEVTLNIYSDNAGVPGTALWSGVAKTLPTFGECCGLAVAKIKGGLALTKGTPYWVAVTTDKKEDTTFAAWSIGTIDQIDTTPVAQNSGQGWSSYASTQPGAFAVYK